MRLTVVAIIWIITSCSINSRNTNDKNNLTHKTVEKFDINAFKNKNIRAGEIYSEVKNDTIVESSEQGDVYAKNTHALNSPYVNKKTYYKDNYQLKAEVNYFYKFPVGISNKYDLEGKVVETKNWDEKYPFSVSQLVDKMKDDVNIDLMNSSIIGIDRRFENDAYYYVIIVRDLIPTSKVREIKVNGSNGVIVSDQIKNLQKN